LDGTQAAALLGDQFGLGLDSFHLALQLAILELNVGDILPHLWGAGDLLSEELGGTRAIIAIPGILNAPDSV
jgi:hypothetical protein